MAVYFKGALGVGIRFLLSPRNDAFNLTRFAEGRCCIDEPDRQLFRSSRGGGYRAVRLEL